MAKIAFSKLKTAINTEVSIVEWNNESIEVKQYLPVDEKLALIGRVLTQCQDTDNNIYLNPLKMKVYFTLEVVFAYTNISFTEKQKENLTKLYDAIVSSGLWNTICENMDAYELVHLTDDLDKSAKSVYEYRQSALGIIDSTQQDYSNLNLDAQAIANTLKDGTNLPLLRDILKLDNVLD